MIDAISRSILNIIQRDARATNADIGRRVGLAPSAVFQRVRKLERLGVVHGYRGALDPAALGLGLLAFVFVRASGRRGGDDVGRLLAKAPEVLEVHTVAGEDCFLAKVRARDTSDLDRILHTRFRRITAIHGTRTIIVLKTFKESAALFVP